MKTYVRVLFLGDVVGALGRTMVQKHLPHIRKQYDIDAVVVNGENSAQGKGITTRIIRSFKHMGVDVITTGNHVWAKREVYAYLQEAKDVLRPANFPSVCPGTGVAIFTLQSGVSIGVINVQGRVFMHHHVDCPFRTVESLLTYVHSRTNLVFVDMHAETTSEKMALGHFLDGKVTGVVGTHTHVQTADERILPHGTAFITDLGMAGALNGMLGMQTAPVLNNFLTQMPHAFVVENKGPAVLGGVYIDGDIETGSAVRIERIKIVDESISSVEEDEK